MTETGNYKVCWVGDRQIKAHRAVWLAAGREIPPGYEIDHINGKKWDNCLENLRLVTRQQNSFNQGVCKNNKSGYKGVCWYKAGSKWHASICVNGKKIHLGYFKTKENAATAYNFAAKKYFGEYARCNKPLEVGCVNR